MIILEVPLTLELILDLIAEAIPPEDHTKNMVYLTIGSMCKQLGMGPEALLAHLKVGPGR